MNDFRQPTSGFAAASLVALFFFAAPARGQPADATDDRPAARRVENPLAAPEAPPAAAGQLTKPPELLEQVEAAWPEEAKAARVTGAVSLLVDLDERGEVTRVEIVEPAGHGFDEAALEAVKRFRFSPAEIDGKPAAVRIVYRYHFVLRPEEPAPIPVEAAVTFRGRVLQRGKREPIAAAAVGVDAGAFGAVTDEQGSFEIAGVPPGRHPVSVTAAGCERFETEEEIVEGQVTQVTYYVRRRVFAPYETVVRGRRERKEVARVELKQEEIRLVPGTQGDAFKVVQNLPGVARAPYGFGLLIVRGGRPFDTRVYLDGVYIPLVFHFGGVTSVFNSDLLEDLTFLPGNFGAKSGRATGGVIEAETRSPSREAYHGYANVGVLDATVLAEGPVTPSTSFATAGRISYVDLVLKSVLPASWGIDFLTPRYWDFQVKLDWAPGDGRDQVRLLAFGSRDTLRLLLDNPALYDPEGRASLDAMIGFQRLVGTWTHTFTPSLKHRLTVAPAYDTSSSALGDDIRSDTTIATVQVRDALGWEVSPALSVEVGTDTFVGGFNVDAVTAPLPQLHEIPDPIASRQLTLVHDEGFLFEPAAYVEVVAKPLKGLRLVPSLRFDYERTLGYTTWDPRLAAFQEIGESTAVKAGLGVFSQPPDFRAGQWNAQLGNPALGAERSVHAMVGVERRLGEAVTVDVQGYYKWLTDQAQRSTRVVVRGGLEVPERWNNGGIGRAYGLEVLLRHELTRSFFGWIAYSLSRSERLDSYDRKGGWRLFSLDQPHNLVAVASYKWPGDWVTGARLRYTSGPLQTPIASRVYDADADFHIPVPGRLFSERGPAFFSLDLRVDKRFVFKQWTLYAWLDVQNATNRRNVEYATYNFDFTKRGYLQGLPIFPTFGVKAEY